MLRKFNPQFFPGCQAIEMTRFQIMIIMSTEGRMMSVKKTELEMLIDNIQYHKHNEILAKRPGSPIAVSYETMKNAEWDKILKDCNAPVGFTHNDLSLYPRSKK